tara:strand:+ start:466 stop:726 length:261 start_codon:yes stop_codon:yes gene_type:complete
MTKLEELRASKKEYMDSRVATKKAWSTYDESCGNLNIFEDQYAYSLVTQAQYFENTCKADYYDVLEEHKCEVNMRLAEALENKDDH